MLQDEDLLLSKPPFQLKIIFKGRSLPSKEVAVPEVAFRDGKLPYYNLMDILCSNLPENSQITKVRYLDHNSQHPFNINNDFELDPNQFPSNYAQIIIELTKANPTPSISHQKRRDLAIPRNNKQIQDLQFRVDKQDQVIAGLKVIISVLIKFQGINGPGIDKILEKVYSENEIEKLELFKYIPMESSSSHLQSPSLTDKHASLTLTKNISFDKEIEFLNQNSSNSQPQAQSQNYTNRGDRIRDKDILHFGILYSDPLVHIVKKKNKPKTALLTSDPVDFANECRAILKSLEAHDKKLNVNIECASTDQLTHLIQKKPKVMHIMCHGEFDPELGEFYLEFENRHGELLQLSTSTMDQMLTGLDLSGVKIVFVNACHSEMVARVFLDHGVDCIVVIDSRHKIEDTFARHFSNYFYTQLIEGKSINQAFQNAIMQVKALNLNTAHSCCCGHSHKETCTWYKRAQTEGMFYAHNSHVPCCGCPDRDKHIHKNNCSWVDNFMFEFDADCPFLGDDPESSDILFCCCSPELTHDEAMKLKLFFRNDDERLGDQVIFSKLNSGKLNQINQNYFGNSKFKDCTTIGQNIILYNMLKSLAQDKHRLLFLFGEKGSGKTTISKHFANYLIERHFINNIKYVQMAHVTSINAFTQKTPWHRYTSSFGVEHFQRNSKETENTLVILDHMDELLENHYNEFIGITDGILEETNLIFLVVTNKNFTDSSEEESRFSKTFPVKYLDTQSAAKLLILKNAEYLPFIYRNIVELQSHDILKQCRLTPVIIKDIGLMLRDGLMMNEIVEKLKASNKSKLSSDSGNRCQDEKEKSVIENKRNFMRELKIIEEQAQHLLIFLATFPNGLLVSDLQNASESQIINQEGWVEQLIKLYNAKNITEYQEVDIGQDLERMIDMNENEHDVILAFIQKKLAFSPRGAWMEITRVQVAGKEAILIKPNLQTRTILLSDKTINDDSFWSLFVSMHYFRLFYTTVIRRHQLALTSPECLIENSLLNSTNAWGSSRAIEESKLFSFLDENVPLEEIEELVKRHEINFASLLQEQSQFNLIMGIQYLEASQNHEEKQMIHTYIRLFENVSMLYLTVTKIYKNYDKCLENSEKVRTILNTKSQDLRFKRIDAQVELYIANIYLQKIFQTRELTQTLSIDQILSQLVSLDQITMCLVDSDFVVFRCEFLITSYEIYRQLSKWNRFFQKGQKRIKYQGRMDMIFKDMLKMREELDKKEFQGYEFLVAKLSYKIIHIKYHKEESDKDDMAVLARARAIFEKYGSLRLVLQSINLQSKYFKNVPEKLMQYSREGLYLANKLKDNLLVNNFKMAINNSQNEIRYKFENKFVFLSSRTWNVDYSPIHGGICFGLSAYSLMMRTLKSSNKKIAAQFGRFTPQTLQMLLSPHKGCKLLLLDLEYSSEDKILLEKENELANVEMTVDEFVALVDSQMQDCTTVTIDIIVVLGESPTARKVALRLQKFIPVVIYFEFSEESTHFTDMLPTYVNRLFSLEFVNRLVKNLIKEFELSQAIAHAQETTIEAISHQLVKQFRVLEVNFTNYQINSKTVEFPNVELFLRGCVQCKYWDSFDLKQTLQPGKFEDISRIQRSLMYNSGVGYMVRRDEIIKVYQLLKENQVVSIHGESGLGKTVFAKQLLNELTLRNVYRHGVFYFCLSDAFLKPSSEQSLVDLITDSFGIEFEQDIDNFFRSQKPLIIIDDFDLAGTENQMPYPKFLFRKIAKNEVKTIIISRYKYPSFEELGVPVTFELKRFSPQQSLIQLLSFRQNLFVKFAKLNEAKLLKSTAIQEAEGLPQKLSDNRGQFLKRDLNSSLSTLDTQDLNDTNQSMMDIYTEMEKLEMQHTQSLTNNFLSPLEGSRIVSPELRNTASLNVQNKNQTTSFTKKKRKTRRKKKNKGKNRYPYSKGNSNKSNRVDSDSEKQ